MAVQLNHHIVHSRDPEASAQLLTELLDLPAPTRFGPFIVVQAANDVSLDFMETQEEKYLVPNHYAFLVSETEFDDVWRRIKDRGIDFYADPAGRKKGETNHHFGGRGLYWAGPDGHWMEIITRPYGSSP